MLPPSASAAPIMRQPHFEMPMTSHSLPAGMIFVWSWRLSTSGGMPPSTFTMNENWSGFFRTPMSSSGQMPCVCPVSKHSSSGFTPASFIASSSLMIFAYVFGKTMSKTNCFRFSRVLRVVHRAHVEGGDLRAALA